MSLVTPNGEELVEKRKSQSEVQKILEDLAPKNKEQEAILAREVGKRLEENRKRRMLGGLKQGFDGTFQKNHMLKKEGGADSPSKDWRLIAAVPREMAYVARQIWGEDVFTDPNKFKEAFVKDELGQYCLTVDPKKI